MVEAYIPEKREERKQRENEVAFRTEEHALWVLWVSATPFPRPVQLFRGERSGRVYIGKKQRNTKGAKREQMRHGPARQQTGNLRTRHRKPKLFLDGEKIYIAKTKGQKEMRMGEGKGKGKGNHTTNENMERKKDT
jgi:hypothetical protein